ncbi:NAD(P)H-binding protein [Marinactinospora thermotolerans]|nr:NAD(P)H-binding protein [Marinactinospora thermotolerans]
MTKTPNTDVLVLGGSGKTGRRVTEALRRRGARPRPASRSGGHRFDWYDEETWEPALAGVEAVYLVDAQSADAAERMRAFARLAVDGGARRLVLLSSRDLWMIGDPALLTVEQAVQDSGAEWTLLRPSWFSQNFTEAWFMAEGIAAGELRQPTGDGLDPFIDAEDIAEVAVAALLDDGHAGQAYELTGPRLLSFGDAVAEIARATGRDIGYVPVTEEEYAKEMARRGVAAEEIEQFIMLFGRIRRGANAYLADGVQRALGREPRDFADYAASIEVRGS